MGELSSDYVDRIYYDAQGYTGNVYYFRIVRRSDGAIWDYTSEEFSTSTEWLDSVNIMEQIGDTGQYLIRIDKDLPANDTCDVVIYKRDGAVPVNTDDVEDQYQLKFGGIFGF